MAWPARRSIVLLAAILGWVSSSGVEPLIAAPAATGRAAFGMNLNGLSDFNREWAFVDVFRQSKPWWSQRVGSQQPWDTKQDVAVDAQGWPRLEAGQAAATLMCRGLDGHYPGGTYVCTYEGQGDLHFGLDAQVKRHTPGRLELLVNPTGKGIYLRIDRSDHDDPIRNIRVLMPGFSAASSPFHPTFLERLKPFGVIRFMDWGHTNGSPLVHWSDRITLEHARQSGPRGACLEHMVDLCNELAAEPWFCVPHLADDDYVRQFARLVKERLAPGRRVYLEYSNELWNHGPGFGQGDWLIEQTQTRGLNYAPFVAEQCRRVFQIWHEEWGADQQRVIRVVAGQHANPEKAKNICAALDGEFDAVSCAAYFDTREGRRGGPVFDATATPESILAICLRNVATHTLPFLKRHREIADDWSRRLNRPIPLVCYEAGQHLSAYGKKVPHEQALLDAQHHPQMGVCYQALLAGCREIGVDVLCAYNYVRAKNKQGSWGHLEYQDQPEEQAPKYQLLRQASENPR